MPFAIGCIYINGQIKGCFLWSDGILSLKFSTKVMSIISNVTISIWQYIEQPKHSNKIKKLSWVIDSKQTKYLIKSEEPPFYRVLVFIDLDHHN